MFFGMVAEQWKSTGSCNVSDGEGLLAVCWLSSVLRCGCIQSGFWWILVISVIWKMETKRIGYDIYSR